MSDIEREAFENKFPVPTGVYWSDRAKDYTYESLPFLIACCSYSQMWKTWQAARQAPASGEVEPVYQWREIGETDWMDCSEDWKLKCDQSPEHNSRTLYTHPPAKVPEGVSEALQRLIENSESMGPASREDALLVAKHRHAILTTPTPATTAGAEWVKCPSCGDFAYECDVCGGKPTPPQEQ